MLDNDKHYGKGESRAGPGGWSVGLWWRWRQGCSVNRGVQEAMALNKDLKEVKELVGATQERGF